MEEGKEEISRTLFERFPKTRENNENIDIRGNHDALSRRILPCQTPIENVAPSVSRSRGAFSARFFGRVLSKQTPMSRPPSRPISSFFPLFSFSLLFSAERKGGPLLLFLLARACNNRVDSTATRFFTRSTIHRQIFLYNCSRRRDVGKQNTDAVERSRNDDGRGRVRETRSFHEFLRDSRDIVGERILFFLTIYSFEARIIKDI